jgi:hypothetical protein
MTCNYFDIEAYRGNLVKELLKMLWKRNFKKQIGISEHMRVIGYHVVVTKEYKSLNFCCQKFNHAL